MMPYCRAVRRQKCHLKKAGKRQKGKATDCRYKPKPIVWREAGSSARESLIAVGTAFVAVILFALIVSNFSSYSSTGNVSYTADNGYSTPQVDEPSVDTVMLDSGQSADTDMSQLDISVDTVADYANVLDPTQYRYYDSGIAGFSFAYPVGLYNSVTMNETAHPDRYGTNIQNISFAGSDGSELIFSVSQRIDGQSVE